MELIQLFRIHSFLSAIEIVLASEFFAQAFDVNYGFGVGFDADCGVDCDVNCGVNYDVDCGFDCEVDCGTHSAVDLSADCGVGSSSSFRCR